MQVFARFCISSLGVRTILQKPTPQDGLSVISTIHWRDGEGVFLRVRIGDSLVYRLSVINMFKVFIFYKSISI